MLTTIRAVGLAGGILRWVIQESRIMKNTNSTVTNKSPFPWILCAPLFLVACYRTPLLPPMCLVDVTPSALDFGAVAPANQATRNVGVTNHGGGDCHISGVVLGPNTDPGFAAAAETPTLVIASGDSATLTVTFSPASAQVPLQRTGSLIFQSDDPNQGTVQVPLSATIQTNCTLSIYPTAYDFGQVHLDDTATGSVVITNAGSGSCEVAGLALAAGSDSEFSIGARQANQFTLAPLAVQVIPIAFHAVDAAAPHHRTGHLVFATTDMKQASVAIPLSADIDTGCILTISPTSVSFGNVILNNTVSGSVTLSNGGTDACQVSGVGLDPISDPDFSLPSGQALAFSVAPGATQTITIQFVAADSAPPHQKTGNLVLQTGDPNAPQASVPLSGYVSTVCVEASQWIYTVDTSGTFSRFDPTTLTFTDIGVLACPTSSTPNSMAVDQNAVAWVAYDDGNLFKVDTSTGQCQATSFQPGQYGLQYFGMGFVFDPSTDADTLYIAGGPSQGSPSPATLATVSFPLLQVTQIGTISDGQPEMTGTGDGGLWGFIPRCANSALPAPNPNVTDVLLQIDPTSGATLASYSYTPPSGADGGDCTGSENWAMKFWGGYFWIFVNTSISKVARDNPATIIPVGDTKDASHPNGRYIVGAGVSTCAPLQ
jgi:hypothetical protein